MEHPVQQPLRPQMLYQELDAIDEALHRLKAYMLSIAGTRNTLRAVLDRTGGAVKKKYSEKDILEWQKKTRDDWGM